MLQALEKIPHGWLSPKQGMALLICGSLLLFSLFPVGLLALRDHQTLFERYLAIAMGAHFAIRFLLLLGFAEHLDGDVLSSLLLHLGFVSAFLTRSRLGLGVLAATFSIKII